MDNMQEELDRMQAVLEVENAVPKENSWLKKIGVMPMAGTAYTTQSSHSYGKRKRLRDAFPDGDEAVFLMVPSWVLGSALLMLDVGYVFSIAAAATAALIAFVTFQAVSYKRQNDQQVKKSIYWQLRRIEEDQAIALGKEPDFDHCEKVAKQHLDSLQSAAQERGLSIERRKYPMRITYKSHQNELGDIVYSAVELRADEFLFLERTRRSDQSVWRIAVENAKAI